MQNTVSDSTILSDVIKTILIGRINLVKQTIEQLADKHEAIMEATSGCRAAEIIEERQTEQFKLLNKLQVELAKVK